MAIPLALRYQNPDKDFSLSLIRGQRTPKPPPGMPLNELPIEALPATPQTPAGTTPVGPKEIQEAVGFIDPSQITPSIVLKRSPLVPLSSNYNFFGAPMRGEPAPSEYSGVNPFLKSAVTPRSAEQVQTQTVATTEPKKPSVGEAAGTIAGGVAGAYGLKKGIEYLFGGGGAGAVQAAGGAAGTASTLGPATASAPYGTLTFGGESVGTAMAPVEAGGGLGEAVGVVARPAAGIAGAIGAYDLLSRDKISPVRGGIQGAASGAGLGYAFGGPVGAIPGAIIGGVTGVVKGLSGSSKGEDQMKRDAVRDFLEKNNFAEKNQEGHHVVTLADGSKYDIGKDGPTQVPNFSGEGTHRPYEVDKTNPLSEKAVANLNPLAELITGGDDKLRSDFAGYLSNAAGSNASDEAALKANAISLYEKAGFTPETAKQAIEQLRQSGKVTDEQAKVYTHDIDALYGLITSQVKAKKEDANRGNRRRREGDEGGRNPSRKPRKKPENSAVNTPGEVPTYGANQRETIQVLNEIARRNQGLA